MSCKRFNSDQDPDYENDLSSDRKRLKVIEEDNKEAAVRQIQQIVNTQFSYEVKSKEAEAKDINEKLSQALSMLDQLRVCAVKSYYSFERPCETAVIKTSGYQPPIHPAVKAHIGKRPKRGFASSPGPNQQLPPSKDSCSEKLSTSSLVRPSNDKIERNFKSISSSALASPPPVLPLPSPSLINATSADGGRGSRFKIKKRIVVGSVSKYIPVDKREERDLSTHKWMIYVRGPKEDPFIETFVKKVWFFLHVSYRPNDLVEVSRPPFHLTRRGWGEFPVRIRLHFHNPRNKQQDIIHNLVLDKTNTGLQTLGSETVVDITIFNPDLTSGDPVDNVDATMSERSVVPHDIGGITIPAESNGCGLEVTRESPSKLHVSSRNVSETANVLETVDKCSDKKPEKSPEFTTIKPKNHLKLNIKQETLDESDQKVSEKFLSSFMNDHGAYFNPTNAGLAACSLGNSTLAVAESVDAQSEDLNNSHTSNILKMNIKEEPVDEPEDAALNLPNALSSMMEQLSESADLVNNGQPLSTSPNKCANENRASVTPTKMEPPEATLSTSQQITHVGLSADDLVHKSVEASKSDLPNVKNQDLNVIPNHFDASSSVNNLPVLVIPQKSQTLNSPASSVANVSIKTPFSKLTPANSLNTLRPQSPLVKQDGQPQTSNGVATFVKCVDKQGNLYLIPLAMFLKMNQTSEMSVNAASNSTASSSSSLLKPLTNFQAAAGSSTNHALNSSWPKAPPVVNLPSSTSSSSMQQSLLVNSKVPQIAQMNNRSLLLPQNSVSLLAASQRTKLQLAGVGCTSTAKTMVSCLVKNRLAANSKVQATCETKEAPSLNMDLFETMDGIVRILVKTFPLFTQNPDRILHPYCAPSHEDFLKWNVGKRHAAEWQRARAIQSKILQLIPNSSKWNSVKVWSIKRLLLWCRHHGYSPMKLDEECVDSNVNLDFDQFSTYTESTRLLETLTKEMDQCKDLLVVPENAAEEEDIDIITVEEKPKLKPTRSPEKPVVHPVIHVASTPCGEFIRETVEQIGLELLSEEVCADVVAPLAEEVLLSAVKQFAEEILSTSIANAFKRNGNKRCPSIITMLNVGNAIRDIPKCDFLTNNYLGTSIPKTRYSNMVNVNL